MKSAQTKIEDNIIINIVDDLIWRANYSLYWSVVFLFLIVLSIGAGLAYYIFYSATLASGDAQLIGAAQKKFILEGINDGRERLITEYRKVVEKPDLFLKIANTDVEFRGHAGEANSVTFSHDGDRIVSGGDDGTVRLWDTQGQPIGQPFKGHEGPVWSVAFSPNGDRIVSGCDNGTVRLWDLQGQPIGQPFKGHEGSVNSIAFSPDGDRIVSGGVDGTVRLWSENGQILTQYINVSDGGNALAYNRNSIVTISGTYLSVLRIELPSGVSEVQDFGEIFRFEMSGLGKRLLKVIDLFKSGTSGTTAGNAYSELLGINDRWIELDRQLKAAEATQDGKDDAGGVDNAFQDKAWLSLNITRIGTIVVVLFLVQVFISMYRYNTRLSAFYRARAHALQLYVWGMDNDEEFARLALAMTPDSLDFGKTPSSPSEQVIKAVEKIATLRSKP